MNLRRFLNFLIFFYYSLQKGEFLQNLRCFYRVKRAAFKKLFYISCFILLVLDVSCIFSSRSFSTSPRRSYSEFTVFFLIT